LRGECRSAIRRPSQQELSAGFDLQYEQKFAEARQIFANWESRNREDPFGEVAVADARLKVIGTRTNRSRARLDTLARTQRALGDLEDAVQRPLARGEMLSISLESLSLKETSEAKKR